MPKHTLLSAPDHVDEPQQIQEYRGLVSRVAATQHPVSRPAGRGAVAAVIPVAYLDLLLGAGGPGLASSPAMV